MDSGMDGYLAKPLEAASLRAVLEENLKGLLS
jgi:CheY-like chemotaxis protein